MAVGFRHTVFWSGIGLVGLSVAACQSADRPGGSLAGALFAIDIWEAASRPGQIIRTGDFPALEVARQTSSVGPAPSADETGVRGRVLDGRDRPIAGALVSTSDGRVTLSGVDGAFGLSGPAAPGGAYVAWAEGHVSIAVAGADSAEALTLRLRSRGEDSLGLAPSSETPFEATGRVVGPDGQPAQGVVVVLQDARGGFSAPSMTDETGAYRLTVFAPERRVVGGTLLATGSAEAPWLGAASGIMVSAAQPVIDTNAATTDADPLSATPPTHSLRMALGPSVIGGTPQVDCFLTGDDGSRLALPKAELGWLVAQVPGTRFALHAEAVDAGLGVRSVLHRDRLAIDFGADQTQLSEQWLIPPGWASQPTLTLNEELKWFAGTGADGYHVSLAGRESQGLLWEGLTTRISMPYAYQDTALSGGYTLTLTAWSAADFPTAVSGRSDRLELGQTGDYRFASRRFQVSR